MNRQPGPSATIVMRGRIIDDLSGAADGLTGSATSVVFASPSGRQRLTVPFGAAQRVAGNGIDCNYSLTATVPAQAEPGVWTMIDAWPADMAGNVGHLTAPDWAAKRYPGSFTVVSDTPPDTGPTVPPGSTATSASTSVSVFTTTTTVLDSSTTITTLVPTTTNATTVRPRSTTTTVPVHTESNGPPHRRGANGYWFATTAGRVVGFGGAQRSSVASAGVGGSDRVVGIASTPTGQGYWLTTAAGDVRPFGDAPFYGSMLGRSLALPIVGIAATPTGHGYWFAAADGGIFGFGDARFYGSLSGPTPAVVGMAVRTS